MERASDGVDCLKAYLGAEAAAANIELCVDAPPDLPAGPSISPARLDEILRLPQQLISRPADNRGTTVSFQLPAAKHPPAGR